MRLRVKYHQPLSLLRKAQIFRCVTSRERKISAKYSAINLKEREREKSSTGTEQGSQHKMHIYVPFMCICIYYSYVFWQNVYNTFILHIWFIYTQYARAHTVWNTSSFAIKKSRFDFADELKVGYVRYEHLTQITIKVQLFWRLPYEMLLYSKTNRLWVISDSKKVVE